MGSDLAPEHHIIACFLRSLLVLTIVDWVFLKQMWDRVFGTRYLLGIKSIKGDRGRRIGQRKKSLRCRPDRLGQAGGKLWDNTCHHSVLLGARMIRSLYLCLTQPPDQGYPQKGIPQVGAFTSDEGKPEGGCLAMSSPETWHYIFSFRSNLGIMATCLPHMLYLDAI